MPPVSSFTTATGSSLLKSTVSAFCARAMSRREEIPSTTNTRPAPCRLADATANCPTAPAPSTSTESPAPTSASRAPNQAVG
jgi:hypothetical protein